MSISYDYEANYGNNPTPSPGCDYQSLLNDTDSLNFQNMGKYSPIDTEKCDSSELQKLRSQNLFLLAQIELITKEKEMHIKANAQHKIRVEQNLQHLKNTLETQLAQTKQQNDLLLTQNKELSRKLQKLQVSKGPKVVFYKQQLEKLENHYSILLSDKDRTISMLKSELAQKKAKKTVVRKKTASLRGSILTSDLSTPKVKNTNSCVKGKHELDDISQLIVKLEKERAELKESGFDSGRGSFNYQSFKELGDKNKERFEKLQSQHLTHLKNRLSSEF